MSKKDNDSGFGILGFLALGGALAWIRHTGKKNRQESERKVEQENRRRKTKCAFDDGFSESQFRELVLNTTNKIKRLKTVSVDGAIVRCEVESQSGITTWSFNIDFNDHGHITGKYWICTDNSDSIIPNRIAVMISEQLKSIIYGLHQEAHSDFEDPSTAESDSLIDDIVHADHIHSAETHSTIKKSTNGKWIFFIVIPLFVIILVIFSGRNIEQYSDAQRIDWNEIQLNNVIPKPSPLFGEVVVNKEEYLSLFIHKTKESDYDKYLAKCKNFGFTYDVIQVGRCYSAYNIDGYKLSLNYSEVDNKMYINIEKAVEYGSLDWPISAIASLLPMPPSITGEICQNDEHGFEAYVSNMPINEFKNYILSCKDSGFVIDSNEGEKSYTAKNTAGYRLNVTYQDNSVIYISLDEPEYTVTLILECVQNFFFNKYDIDVYLDDTYKQTITHGKAEQLNLTLTKGTFVIRFISSEDSQVYEEIELNIENSKHVKYLITCSSDDIAVKPVRILSSYDNKMLPDDFKVNYDSAESFEKALNDGVKVAGKIVQFYVNDYKPSSALGINCLSGEHLNFISKEELIVESGDYVIGQVIEEPSKVLRSWKIPYEVLLINKEQTYFEIATPEDSFQLNNDVSTNHNSIAMVADDHAYVGKTASSVETEFKKLGFTHIIVSQIVTTDTANIDGHVAYVTANESSFMSGDQYYSDTIINIYSWKVDVPISEYELAFVRQMSNYSLYYMFDIDMQEVITFSTQDTYVDIGTYTGSIDSGLTITWDHGEWTEKFTYKSSNSYATMVDGNGFDWEFAVCDVFTAQTCLSAIQ